MSYEAEIADPPPMQKETLTWLHQSSPGAESEAVAEVVVAAEEVAAAPQKQRTHRAKEECNVASLRRRPEEARM